MKEKTYAIEELRSMVGYFNTQHEGVNTSYTMGQLHKIWRFVQSEQGGRVHECYDHWPRYLMRAVLRAKLGAKLPEKIVKRAGEEC
jgi:hypothetical protein